MEVFQKDSIGIPIKVGDIVQIINPEHHWFPALLVIDELKGWGVMAYCWIVNNSDEANGQAYIRIKNEDIERVGEAVILTKDSEEEDD